MCLGFGSIYNTTVNVNGRCVGFSHYNSLSPFGCGTFGGFTPGCFGFGFNSHCMGNPFLAGAGVGLGFAAGMTLMPILPSVFKGIGNACSWTWNNAIKPAFQWVGNGVKNLWNNIFHKKEKTEIDKTTETQNNNIKTNT